MANGQNFKTSGAVHRYIGGGDRASETGVTARPKKAEIRADCTRQTRSGRIVAMSTPEGPQSPAPFDFLASWRSGRLVAPSGRVAAPGRLLVSAP